MSASFAIVAAQLAAVPLAAKRPGAGGRPFSLPAETRCAVITLLDAGVSQSDVARQLDVHRYQVVDIVRRRRAGRVEI